MIIKNGIVARLIIFFFFILSNILSQQKEDQNSNYYKISKVRIYYEGNNNLISLNNTGVLIDSYIIRDNYLETYLNSNQLNILNKSNYKYEILINDMTKYFLEQNSKYFQKNMLNKKNNNSSFNYGSMGGYYTYTEMVSQLDTMFHLFSNIITKKYSIGKSIEGHDIWAVKISDNPNIEENEPQVLYNSLIHAREPMGMMSLVYFMYYLLENYNSNNEVTYLVNNRELYFVLVLNPDGYVFNEQMSPNGGGFWRKNRRNNSEYEYGVDLNRNFGFQWGYDNIGSSPDSSSEIYRGKNPFSEPETQAMRDFCIEHNFLITINNHAYGNYVIPPWGYEDIATQDSSVFENLIKIANTQNNYVKGRPYTTNGDALDWMYGEQQIKNKIFALTPEIGHSFWPTLNEIIPIAKDNLYSNLVYAWGPGIIEDLPFPPTVKIDKKYLNPINDSLNIFVNNLNLDNPACNVYAQIVNDSDSVINEIELTKIDSFTYNWVLNLENEEFYNLRIKQQGTDIPYNLYSKNSKITTAGPLVIENISITTDRLGWATIKPIVKNMGKAKEVKNVSISIVTKDSIIIESYPKNLLLNYIKAGAISNLDKVFTINYDINKFKDIFNLKFEISSNDIVYWIDSSETIITGNGNNEISQISFNLEQNYPNPFNPTTIINYSIPFSNMVKLSVYDLLGREVKILVNKYKSKGNYDVIFDASNFSSGIYIYKLVMGRFVMTKKMIFIK